MTKYLSCPTDLKDKGLAICGDSLCDEDETLCVDPDDEDGPYATIRGEDDGNYISRRSLNDSDFEDIRDINDIFHLLRKRKARNTIVKHNDGTEEAIGLNSPPYPSAGKWGLQNPIYDRMINLAHPESCGNPQIQTYSVDNSNSYKFASKLKVS